jgi:phospholipase/lecithinase/hemolysin
MGKWLAGTLVVIGLGHAAQADQLRQLERFSPFEEVIAFGDSLTDVGNVAEITEDGTAPRIDGYYEESHYSDNIIWVEYMADFWALPARTPGRGDVPTLPAEPDGNTWAWGSAEAAAGTVTVEGVTEPIPNLLTQIEQYLDSNTPASRTLFVIWSGADNLLVGEKFGPRGAWQAVAAVIQAMRELEQAGARHILVVNMPKLGDTPEAQAGRIDEAAANLYSVLFNGFLNRRLALLRRDRRFDATIYFANAYTELALIVDTVNAGRTYRPRFFVPGPPVAISNVTDEALDVYDQNGTFPDDYLFWDDVHPTTQGYQIIVGKMLQAVRWGIIANLRR